LGRPGRGCYILIGMCTIILIPVDGSGCDNTWRSTVADVVWQAPL